MPFNITSHDKTYLSAPRFVHILALGYFLSQLQTVTRLSAHALASPVRLIGRHGLLVFASGTVLALICQVAMMARPEAQWMPWVLPLVGTAALYGIAWIAETSRQVLAAPAEPAPVSLKAPTAEATPSLYERWSSLRPHLRHASHASPSPPAISAMCRGRMPRPVAVFSPGW